MSGISDMIIRKAALEDAAELIGLHSRAILELCRDDYTPDQLQYWLSYSTLEKFQERLANQPSFVAEFNDKIIGYVRRNPEIDELCSIFVDPDNIQQGVATALMEVAYQDAISQGVKELWLFASLTMVPIYQAIGWQYHQRRMRGLLECVKMIKSIG
jgi:putative acetyltransferase